MDLTRRSRGGGGGAVIGDQTDLRRGVVVAIGEG